VVSFLQTLRSYPSLAWKVLEVEASLEPDAFHQYDREETIPPPLPNCAALKLFLTEEALDRGLNEPFLEIVDWVLACPKSNALVIDIRIWDSLVVSSDDPSVLTSDWLKNVETIHLISFDSRSRSAESSSWVKHDSVSSLRFEADLRHQRTDNDISVIIEGGPEMIMAYASELLSIGAPIPRTLTISDLQETFLVGKAKDKAEMLFVKIRAAEYREEDREMGMIAVLEAGLSLLAKELENVGYDMPALKTLNVYGTVPSTMNRAEKSALVQRTGIREVCRDLHVFMATELRAVGLDDDESYTSSDSDIDSWNHGGLDWDEDLVLVGHDY
jgi:hypothetical protein